MFMEYLPHSVPGTSGPKGVFCVCTPLRLTDAAEQLCIIRETPQQTGLSSSVLWTYGWVSVSCSLCAVECALVKLGISISAHWF